MRVADLETLYDYNYWARDRVLEAAQYVSPHNLSRELGISYSSILGSMTHILEI